MSIRQIDAYKCQLADEVRKRVQLERQLDEARAELARTKAERDLLFDQHAPLVADRDALRDAVERHNAECRKYECEWEIPLPPSAAPAASEPTMQALTSESESLGLYAAPEAGPKPDYCCIAALDAARARAWKDRNTRCGCDHNESCAECFPPAFHTGGYWDQQRASLQQKDTLREGE